MHLLLEVRLKHASPRHNASLQNKFKSVELVEEIKRRM